MVLEGVPPDHEQRAPRLFKAPTGLVPTIARRGPQQLRSRAKRRFECRFARLGQFDQDNLKHAPRACGLRQGIRIGLRSHSMTRPVFR